MPDRPDAPEPRYPIASVDRTLRLLKELKRRPQVSLTQTREILGIGQSTAHRLLQMLAYEGFAVQDKRTRTYMAGPELVGFNPVDGLHPKLMKKSQALIQALAARCGETVHLAVLNGAYVRYVAGVESAAVLRVSSRAGDFTPAYASSLGKAMLASYDDDVVVGLLQGVRFERVTHRTIRTLDHLLDDLNAVRRRGYATNIGEAEDGVTSTSMASPVPGPSSMVGISVATPLHRHSEARVEEHVALLRVATKRLAAELRES